MAINMKNRNHQYLAAGAIVIVALVLGGIIAMNRQNPKNVGTPQTSNSTTSAGAAPRTSEEIKTPTNKDELSKTLNDDATSIGSDIQNLENDDYSDNSLTDSSLYN
jgi:hypothetical protein